jgi:hypothetical protein
MLHRYLTVFMFHRISLQFCSVGSNKDVVTGYRFRFGMHQIQISVRGPVILPGHIGDFHRFILVYAGVTL